MLYTYTESVSVETEQPRKEWSTYVKKYIKNKEQSSVFDLSHHFQEIYI